MFPGQSPYVSLALRRLRRGVNVCCWCAGAALVAQVLIWCIASFTEMRSETIKDKVDPTAIVKSHVQPVATTVVPSATPKVTSSQSSKGRRAVDPNRVYSRVDPVLAILNSFAMATGTLAVLVLFLLLSLGVMLGVSSSTQGVEDVVSAFMWCAFLSLLILPIGTWAGLPWTEGALTSYALMTRSVELALADRSWGNPTFYARFGLFPLACVSALTIIGLRFHSGVSAGIVKNDARLDPVLEKETAAIRPSSLHGGRAGHAMRAAVAAAIPEPAITDTPVTQVSAGRAPRRLI